MKLPIDESMDMPGGVTASYANCILTIKGPKGEVSKEMRDPHLKIAAEQNKFKISCKVASRRQKRMINTYLAHVKNMVAGVQQPYQYMLKVCSGHFPMNVSVRRSLIIVSGEILHGELPHA